MQTRVLALGVMIDDFWGLNKYYVNIGFPQSIVLRNGD